MPRRINPELVPLRRFVCTVTLANGRSFTTTIHARTPHDAERSRAFETDSPVSRIKVHQELSA